MKTRNVYGKWIAVGGAAAAVVLIGINVQSSLAYPRWNEGCQECHGAFDDNTSPQGTQFPNDGKHGMHNRAQNMDTDCLMCHVNTGDNPLLYVSGSDGFGGGPGPGCVGCHGRDYDGATGISGVGLRQHHFINDVLACVGCHPNDPDPLPENILPPYYGSPDTNASNPCNPGGVGENFSEDEDNNRGLDNDGDNLYDETDPDCGGVDPCPWDCQPGGGNGQVDILDFLAILAQFGGPGDCDFDGNQVVDIQDFLKWLSRFGPCP